MAYLHAELRKSHHVIKQMLAGLQSAFWDQGLLSPLQHPASGKQYALLGRVMRGIKKQQPGVAKVRLPLIVPMLSEVVAWLHRGAPAGPKGWMRADRKMLAAALTMAEFALLRVGEFTCPSSTEYDPDTTMLVSDIELAGGPAAAGTEGTARMIVNVKASKVDVFRKGVKITCHSTGGTVDAARLIPRGARYPGSICAAIRAAGRQVPHTL